MNIPFSSRPINHLDARGIPRGLYRATSSGLIWSTESEQMLKSQRREDGYYEVDLKFDGKRVKQKVHRLVCQAFHGDPDDPSMEANHLDGDRSNNKPSNLEWATHAENIRHRNEVLRSNPGGKRAKPVGILLEDEIRICKSHVEAIEYLQTSPPKFYEMLRRREDIYPISNPEEVFDERYEDRQEQSERSPIAGYGGASEQSEAQGRAGSDSQRGSGGQEERGGQEGPALSSQAQSIIEKWRQKGQKRAYSTGSNG